MWIFLCSCAGVMLRNVEMCLHSTLLRFRCVFFSYLWLKWYYKLGTTNILDYYQNIIFHIFGSLFVEVIWGTILIWSLSYLFSYETNLCWFEFVNSGFPAALFCNYIFMMENLRRMSMSSAGMIAWMFAAN